MSEGWFGSGGSGDPVEEILFGYTVHQSSRRSRSIIGEAFPQGEVDVFGPVEVIETLESLSSDETIIPEDKFRDSAGELMTRQLANYINSNYDALVVLAPDTELASNREPNLAFDLYVQTWPDLQVPFYYLNPGSKPEKFTYFNYLYRHHGKSFKQQARKSALFCFYVLLLPVNILLFFIYNTVNLLHSFFRHLKHRNF